MDPLSIAAFAATVLEIGMRVSGHTSGLVQTWKTAEPVILALANETADLMIVLDHFATTQQAIEKSSRVMADVQGSNRLQDGKDADESREDPFVPAFYAALGQANDRLEKLEKLILHLGSLSRTRRKYAWMQKSDEAKDIQNGLRDVRTRMTELLLSYNCASVSRIELQVSEIRSAVTEIATGSKSMVLEKPISTVHQPGTNVRNQQYRRLDCPSNLVPILAYLASSGSSSNPVIATAQNNPVVQITTSAVVNACGTTCTCRCHSRPRRVLRLKNGWLGNVFVGYNGIPVMSPACTVRTCKKRTSLVVSYTFPAWFILSGITAYLSTSATGPLQAGLFVANRVDWKVYGHHHLAGDNDVTSLHCLFLQDPYMVNYLSPNGEHALWWSMTCGNIDVLAYLMQRGADADLEDDTGQSPRTGLATLALIYGLNHRFIQQAIQILDVSRILSEAPLLVKALAGIIQLDVVKMLETVSPAQARELANPPFEPSGLPAPLHLATRRLDLAAMRALLAAGADPNAMRPSQGYRPLFMLPVPHQVPAHRQARHAADVEEAVAMLVEAGADAEAGCFDGQRPLHRAAAAGNVAAMRSLLAHGAEVDTLTCIGGGFFKPVKGGGSRESPAVLAAGADQVGSLQFLFDAGADLGPGSPGYKAKQRRNQQQEQQRQQGVTEGPSIGVEDVSCPINKAMVNKASSSFEFLLHHGCSHLVREDQDTILHTAAVSADVEMLETMARNGDRLWGLEMSERSSEGLTPQEHFDRRVHISEETQCAWDRMVASLPCSKTTVASINEMLQRIQLNSEGEKEDSEDDEDVFHDAVEMEKTEERSVATENDFGVNVSASC